MLESKRATVVFDPGVYKALRLKAARSKCSVSDLVNAAVSQMLAEDQADLAAFPQRAGEPDLSFAHVLKDLKRRAKL